MKHRGNPRARQAHAARLERAEERRAKEETAAAEAAARGVGSEMRREKSLRIGVHHANGVVWEPVYVTRTRLTS